MFKKFLIGFSLFFSISEVVISQDRVIDQIVAVVGSNIILKSDIEDMYMARQAQGLTTSGDMKCEILEDLLMEKLLLAEAELDSTIEVTPNQVNQHLDDRMQYFIRNLGSEKAVEQHFNKPFAMVKADAEEYIRNSLMTMQMQNKIIKDVKTTPAEVRYYYRNLEQEKIPLINTQVEYAQITVFPLITLEEENIIKNKLREFKTRIENGESFTTFAIMYSEDSHAANGGELGYVGRANLDPAYAAAAFNLRDNNKVSNVVKTKSGYHIIQLIGRRGETINTRHIILKPKPSPEAMKNAKTSLDSLATLIRRQKITFEAAAIHYSADTDSRVGGGIAINPDNLSSKWGITELEPDVSKVLANLKENEISDPFLTTDEKSELTVYKIVKLISRTKEHKANIQEDYQFLSRLYQSQKEEEALTKWINQQQSKTYIHLDDTYTNCIFKFDGWIK